MRGAADRQRGDLNSHSETPSPLPCPCPQPQPHFTPHPPTRSAKVVVEDAIDERCGMIDLGSMGIKDNQGSTIAEIDQTGVVVGNHGSQVNLNKILVMQYSPLGSFRHSTPAACRLLTFANQPPCNQTTCISWGSLKIFRSRRSVLLPCT